MWVQVQNFFGQRLPQAWADNGSFAINALDNLSGSDALIGVRSRGNFNRPFTVVDELQRTAQERFHQKEQALQARLAATEEKLFALQQATDPERLLLTEEQQAAMQVLAESYNCVKNCVKCVISSSPDLESLGTS